MFAYLNPQDSLTPDHWALRSSLQGRNHSPTSPAFHRGSPQNPTGLSHPDHTLRMVRSARSHEVGSSPSAPAASARALAHNRGRMAASAGRDWWAGRREERYPPEGKRGVHAERTLQTCCRGPETSSEQPENLLQGGVKDDVQPGPRPGSTADPHPGDRRPALRALAPHPHGGPASRLPGGGTPAPPFPSPHAPEAPVVPVPFGKGGALRSGPCCSYHVFSFELRVLGERGHGVSGREHGTRANAGQGSGESGARQAESPGARRALWRRRPAPPRPLAPLPSRPASPSAPRGQPSPQPLDPGPQLFLSLLAATWTCCYSTSLCLELTGEQRPSSCLLHLFIRSFIHSPQLPTPSVLQAVVPGVRLLR